ncbi:transketolase [Massilia sp. JS1662]|nr:transketolase [Massilia sp. JS1662]
MRKTVLEMAFHGSTVHIGCAFSIIELLSVLYRNHLHYPEGNPDAEDRDYLVLSKGHGVMAQYACMVELGWLEHEKHVKGYFKNGSDLKGLSDSRVKGLEVTSGSLGHGFSVAVGIALGLKKKNSSRKVYVIVGDGEINEGPIWEGMLFAAHHKLDNLMLIVDKNGFQAMGKTDDVMTLGDLGAKLRSFDFSTVEIDGHSESAVDAAVRSLWADGTSLPKAIVANTVKGKGVPFMEHDNRWHYTRLNQETFERAIAALKSGAGELK